MGGERLVHQLCLQGRSRNLVNTVTEMCGEQTAIFPNQLQSQQNEHAYNTSILDFRWHISGKIQAWSSFGILRCVICIKYVNRQTDPFGGDSE